MSDPLLSEGKESNQKGDLLHRAQPAPQDQPVEFPVLSPLRQKDPLFAAILAGASLVIGIIASVLTSSTDPLIFTLYIALVSGFAAIFFWHKSLKKLVIRGTRLAYHDGSRVHHFNLPDCIVSLPSGRSYGGYANEYVNFEPEAYGGGKVRVYLPDLEVKGDLVRERLLAILASRGADVRVPGFITPLGGAKEVQEVPITEDAALQSTPLWQYLAAASICIICVLILGRSVGFLLILPFLAVAAAVIYVKVTRRFKPSVRSRTVIFSPENLTSRRGGEVEWEIPRDMLLGLVVETRETPFRRCEARVVAKTPYHRSLALVDWSPVTSLARANLLSHARARGIPVQIKCGGEEPGSGSMKELGPLDEGRGTGGGQPGE